MDQELAYTVLTEGAGVLNLQGYDVPSELLLFGRDTVPICVNKSGQVMIAAGAYGDGKMVVLSHEQQLLNESFEHLIVNAVDWLAPNEMPLVGVQEKYKDVATMLKKYRIGVKIMDDFDDSVGIYICDCYDDKKHREIGLFVRTGGGLLIAGQAWNWAHQNPGEDVFTKFSGNSVTGLAGIFITANYNIHKELCDIGRNIPLCASLQPYEKDNAGFLKSLLEGINAFAYNVNTGSRLLVHGPLAFPVGVTDDGTVFIAAGRYGQGRIVVVSHEGFFKHPPLQPFYVNCIKWLQRRDAKAVSVVMTTHSAFNDMFEYMNNVFNCKRSNELTDEANVFCCTTYIDMKAKDLHEFVARGGGLFIGGQSWYWHSNNSERNTLMDCPGNKILNPLGFGLMETHLPTNVFPVSPDIRAGSYHHLRKTIVSFATSKATTVKSLLSAVNDKFLHSFEWECWAFSGSEDFTNWHYKAVIQQTKTVLDAIDFNYISKATPVTSENEKYMLMACHYLYRAIPDTPDNYGKKETITVDGFNKVNEAWRSTGMYLSPKTQATVSVTGDVITKNWKIQIGCHTDNLSKLEKVSRPPVVVNRYTIKTELTHVSSLYGGLLYVIIPGKSSDKKLINITISNADKIPYYIHGVTDNKDWVQHLKSSMSPMAELEAENIILTVRREDILELLDPSPMMYHWDIMIRAMTNLSSLPPVYDRKERIVADVQIQAGTMHAGYPVMIHNYSTHEITDVRRLKTKGLWGPIHELGHNRQRDKFGKLYGFELRPYTTEATCNLWVVFVHEEVLDIHVRGKSEAHRNMFPEERKKRIEEFIAKGSRLDDWYDWTSLETYLQLQEGFGWEPYRKVFAVYQTLDVKEDIKERMNLFAKTFSFQVQKNLVPFFRAWAWHIDESVAKVLSALPTWKENPMAKYG